MLFTFAMYPYLMGTSELKLKHLRKIVFFQSCFSNISSIQPRNRGSMLTSAALYPFDFFPTWVFEIVFKLSAWPRCLFVSYFSPMWVFKCIFNLLSSVEVKLQWLHLSDFSSMCPFKWLAREKMPSMLMCFLKICVLRLPAWIDA